MATARNIELNRWLVSGWSAEDVLKVVKEHLQEFNLVNCTTALQRLAKATVGRDSACVRGKGARQQHKSRQRSHEMLNLLARTLKFVQEKGAWCPAQNIANALWACERLGLDDAPEIPALVEVARAAVADARRLAGFSGQNLANIVWAVAKLGAGDFRSFSAAIEKRVTDLNGQELSMVAWALGTVGDVQSKAIQSVASQALYLKVGRKKGADTLSAQQLSTLAWALARLACHGHPLLGDIAKVAPTRVAAGEFNAQDLANIAWAFGRLESPAPDLFAQISRFVSSTVGSSTEGGNATNHRRSRRSDVRNGGVRSLSVVDFSPQQLAVLCWAFAKLSVKEAGKTVLQIVREVRGRLPEFAPRDLTDIIWAVAALGLQAPKFVEAAGDVARERLAEFNSQELLRFLGAFRRAGGSGTQQAALSSVQRELCYEFPSLKDVRVILSAETPGRRKAKKRSNSSPVDGGDPQRADGGTTGVSLWEASFALGEWLSRQRQGLAGAAEIDRVLPKGKWHRWQGKVGVELGAGLGLPSIVAAHLGASMVATDGDPAVLRLLATNTERNAPAGGSPRLRAQTLLWGARDPLSQLGLSRLPDVLLAADVVYASAKEELTDKLMSTILDLTGPHTLVLMCNVSRFPEGHPKGEGTFFASMERFFDQVVLPQRCLHGDFHKTGVGSCVLRALCRRPSITTMASVSGRGHENAFASKKKKRTALNTTTKSKQLPAMSSMIERPRKRKSHAKSKVHPREFDANDVLDEGTWRCRKARRFPRTGETGDLNATGISGASGESKGDGLGLRKRRKKLARLMASDAKVSSDRKLRSRSLKVKRLQKQVGSSCC